IHTKRTVHSRDGMVTARSPLAAAAGAEMLRAGGNALDAAAAAILATGVVHPFATGLGGGGLMTICQPGKPGRTLDYRSEASRRASCDSYQLDNRARPGVVGWQGVRDRANEVGPRSVAVPGTVAGLVSAHEMYGRVPWDAVVAPAVSLAQDGYAV